MLDLNRVVSFLEAEHGLIHKGISPKSSGTVQVDFKKGNFQLLVNNPTWRRSINAWLYGRGPLTELTRTLLLRSEWFADAHLLASKRLLPQGHSFADEQAVAGPPVLPSPPRRQ